MKFDNQIIYGAILGDIAGSTLENKFPDKTEPFREMVKKGHFTDDTVLTIAVLDALKHERKMDEAFKDWGSRYFNAGFSTNFKENIIYPEVPKTGECHSNSNGALMMLSPFIAAHKNDNDYRQLIDRMHEAVKVTHNCTECNELAYELIQLARGQAYGFAYACSMRYASIGVYEEMLKTRKFDISAYGTMREAIIIRFISKSFGEAIEKSLILGGDTDTRTCLVGMLAAEAWGMDEEDIELVRDKIPGEMLKIIELP
jgi:ADP-ribosylglycohydrolase